MTYAGTVAAMHRFPVKSMMGEQLNAGVITSAGLAGDRVYALIDGEGKIGTAKIPRKWGNVFRSRARYLAEPNGSIVPAEITLPDGERISTDAPDIDVTLSALVGFDVQLVTDKPMPLVLESPPLGLVPEGDEPLLQLPVPNGFFDLGSLHLVSTATLNTLRSLNPDVRFEPRRFRPNIIVETPPEVTGFVDNAWAGKTLAIGDEVRIKVTMPTIRCVVTTLPQDDLPAEPGVLKTAAAHNNALVGVYASVEEGGMVRVGDPVEVLE